MYTLDELMEFEFFNIKFKISDFRFQTMTTPYPIHYHGKNTIEIHYLKNGSGEVIISNTSYLVKKGFFFIVGEFTKHTQIPSPNDPMDKYSIYLTYDDEECNNPVVKDLIKNITWVGEDKFNSLEIFDKVRYEAEKKNIAYRDLIKEYIKILFINVIRNRYEKISAISQAKDHDNKLFEIEKIFLNEFRDITLPEMASRLKMSERDLQRYIKKAYNKTFNDLKLEARMSFAANKLTYSDIQISALSNMTGYSSTEHFTFAFKKYFGQTPLKYKKEVQKSH